jgi:hypothetical protein
MAEEFKISAQMTKKALIEEHQRLLDAYKAKVAEVEAAEQQAAVAASKVESLAAAREATVDGVIENLGQLRSQVGRTLSELIERMTGQADRLDALKRAIEERERRLEELHDVEAASASLSALMTAYEQRRQAAEEEFAERMQELEDSHRRRAEELETTCQARSTELEQQHAESLQRLDAEISERRQQWQDEQARVEAQSALELEQRQRDRAREEEEYVYQRDRSRRLEEDQSEEEKAQRQRKAAARMKEHEAQLEQQQREHAATLEAARLEQEAELSERERAVAEREAAVGSREQELEELRRRVEELPVRLEEATAAGAREALAQARAEVAHEQKVEALEHEWATRAFKERISQLERDVKDRDAKLKELKADLDAAWRQVNQMAEKALERRSFVPGPAPPTASPRPTEPQDG